MAELSVDGELLAQLLTTNEQEQTELLAALKDADGNKFKSGEELKEAITPFSTKLRKNFKDEGIGQATRTINSNWEKKLAAEGFTPTKKGVELVDEYLDFVQSKMKPVSTEVIKEVELTEETALKNSIVQQLISKRVTAAVASKDAEFKTLQEQVTKQAEQRKDNILRKNIISIAKDANISLGDDEETREERIDTLVFKAKQKAGGFDIEGERIIRPLDKDKNPIKDPVYFSEVSFRDFIVKTVNRDGKLFPISTADKSKTSPKFDQPNHNGKPLQKFESQEHYMELRSKAKTKEEKMELYDAWKAQQAAIK